MTRTDQARRLRRIARKYCPSSSHDHCICERIIAALADVERSTEAKMIAANLESFEITYSRAYAEGQKIERERMEKMVIVLREIIDEGSAQPMGRLLWRLQLLQEQIAAAIRQEPPQNAVEPKEK